MDEKQVHNDIDELIARYLSGEIDHDSFLRLKQWTEESDEHRRYVREFIETDFSAGVAGDTTYFNKEKGYALFRQRIADYQKEIRLYERHFPWRVIGWIVATIIIIFLPLAGFWEGRHYLERQYSLVKMETAMGARTRLTLPDGTDVWLNAGSRLTYPQDFGINHRHLSLEGEAYFDVKHNEKLPFEINTKEIDLRVLGTKFTFSNYAEDETITVDLARGKVHLNDHLYHREMYLLPNERMTYNKRTGEMKKTTINAGNAMAWTKNELFFDEQPLSEIAKELMRAYNVKISVANYLKKKSFYGSFNISQNSAYDILQTFASTGECKIRYKGGTFIIY